MNLLPHNPQFVSFPFRNVMVFPLISIVQDLTHHQSYTHAHALDLLRDVKGQDISNTSQAVHHVVQNQMRNTVIVFHDILYALCCHVIQVKVNAHKFTDVYDSILVSYIGLFTITLVAGILHVYPAPAERVALKRPMLTTGSVSLAEEQLFDWYAFSFRLFDALSPTKSFNFSPLGILEIPIITIEFIESHCKYVNTSVSFVASSALHILNLLNHHVKVKLVALVIVLTTPPIIIFTGFVGVGSLPS